MIIENGGLGVHSQRDCGTAADMARHRDAGIAPGGGWGTLVCQIAGQQRRVGTISLQPVSSASAQHDRSQATCARFGARLVAMRVMLDAFLFGKEAAGGT